MHFAHLLTALGTTFSLTLPHMFVSQNEVFVDTSSAFHKSESNIIVKSKGEHVSISITTDGETVELTYPEDLTPTPSLSITPSPLITPSATPSISPQPTLSPTVSPTVTPILTVSPTPIDEVQNYIMDRINEYRKANGLDVVQTDPYTCAFAETRAKEIATNFSHDGFENRIQEDTLPYPSYSLITENIAMNTNYKDVVKKWIASPGHEQNLRAVRRSFLA
jgi:uncharacterized protein YkwD